MAGIKIAEGFVEVRAKTDQVAKDVEKAGSNAAPAADRSGQSLGKQIVGGISAAFTGLKMAELITGATDRGAVEANLKAKLAGAGDVVSAQAGKAAGAVYAKGYGESLDEVNGAILGIQQNLGGLSEYSQSETQAMAEKALSLADVWGVDVAESTRTAGILMKNGMAKDANEAFDIIAAGYDRGLDSSGEFLDSLNEYSGPLHDLGFTGPAALAAFQAAVDSGAFSIDKAGDAMNEFAIRAIDGSTGSTEAYQALGLNAEDMMQKIANGGQGAQDATSQVISGLAGMSDKVAQDKAGVALFGSMWEDTGSAMVLAMDPAALAVDKVSGSTQKMMDANTSAATTVETTKRAIEGWTNSLITTEGPMGTFAATAAALGPDMIGTGAAVVTAASSLGPMAAGLASTTAGFVAQTGAQIASKAETVALAAMYGVDMVKGLAANGAALVKTGAQYVALGAVQTGQAAKSMATTGAAVVKSTALWLAHGVQVAATGVAYGISKVPMLAGAAATGVMTAAQWALNSAFLANPITWIVVAVVALIAAIVLLIMNWDTVVKFLTDTWSAFMAWIQPALDAVGQWWSGLWQGVKDFVVTIWESIVAGITWYYTTLWNGLVAVGTAIAGWWNGLWSGISKFVSDIWNAVVTFVVAYFTTLWNGIKAVGATLASWWNAYWVGLQTLIGGVIGGIRGLWDGLIGFFQGLPSKVGSAVKGMWDGIASSFKAVLNKIIGWWNNLSFGIPAMNIAGVQITPAVKFNTPNMPMFARGTNYAPGGSAIVGEHGPEIVRLPRGSDVLTNRQSARVGGGGGGGDQVHIDRVVIQIDPKDIKSLQDLLDLFASLGQVARAGGSS